jgi:hypothetical protein
MIQYNTKNIKKNTFLKITLKTANGGRKDENIRTYVGTTNSVTEEKVYFKKAVKIENYIYGETYISSVISFFHINSTDIESIEL